MKFAMKLRQREINKAVKILGRKYPLAAKRAVRKAGTAARTLMTKNIAKDTALPSKRVKDEIKVNPVGAIGVQLVIRGQRLPLIHFKASGPEPSRGKGRGVRYRLPGGRGKAPHAFIATMRSGHRGVFQRSTKARSPVYELRGPSLVRVFEKFLPDGLRRGMEALVKNFRAEVKFALSKR